MFENQMQTERRERRDAPSGTGANVGAVATQITRRRSKAGKRRRHIQKAKHQVGKTKKEPAYDLAAAAKSLDDLAATTNDQEPWRRADLIVDLKDNHQLSYRVIIDEIQKRTGRKFEVPYFSQSYHTAKSFPPNRRFTDRLGYSAHYRAFVTIRGFNIRRDKRNLPPLNYPEQVDKLLKSGVDTNTNRNFKLALVHMLAEPLAKHQPPTIDTDVVNGCTHAFCEEVAHKFGNGQVAWVNLNPVYADALRTPNGKLDISTVHEKISTADNTSAADSIKTTCAAIEKYEPVLIAGGFMTLWQSERIIRPEISTAISKNGLVNVATLIWQKGRGRIGDPRNPVSGTIEMCYVLRRKADDFRIFPQNHPRLSPILDVADGFKQYDEAVMPQFIYQQPVGLLVPMVLAFTLPSELIVDAYAGTGSLSKACILTGRKFAYIESHANAFERFAGLVQQMHDSAATVSDVPM